MHAVLTWLKDSAAVIAACSSAIAIVSEVMPFLPTKANGIAHGVLTALGIVKRVEEARTKQ